MKQHYRLITGIVIFTNEENGESTVGQVTLNALTNGSKEEITRHQIGRAQQSLQMVFRQRQPDPSTEVVDVVITNVTYLGYMTEAEFLAEPEKLNV